MQANPPQLESEARLVDRGAWLYWVLVSAAGHVVASALIIVLRVALGSGDWVLTAQSTRTIDRLRSQFYYAWLPEKPPDIEWFGDAPPVMDETITRPMHYIDALVASSLLGFLAGTMIGIGQALVLRHYIRGVSMREWILLTAIGSTGAWFAGSFVAVNGFLLLICFSIILGGAVFGGVLGYTQVLGIRKYVDNRMLWVIANMIAGVIAMIIVAVIPLLLAFVASEISYYGSVELPLAATLVGSIIYSAITGLALGYIVQRHPSATHLHARSQSTLLAGNR
jgi:hypothetical protein